MMLKQINIIPYLWMKKTKDVLQTCKGGFQCVFMNFKVYMVFELLK